jgi:hypothetical protein
MIRSASAVSSHVPTIRLGAIPEQTSSAGGSSRTHSPDPDNEEEEEEENRGRRESILLAPEDALTRSSRTGRKPRSGSFDPKTFVPTIMFDPNEKTEEDLLPADLRPRTKRLPSISSRITDVLMHNNPHTFTFEEDVADAIFGDVESTKMISQSFIREYDALCLMNYFALLVIFIQTL